MRMFTFVAVLMTLMSTTTAASKRDYLIYDSAGEYALAWGCSNLEVDFSLLNKDEDYRSEVLSKCDVNNYVVNLYEDRIVKTETDVEYFPTRYTNQNHFYISFASMGSWLFNVKNVNANVSFYTIKRESKWQGSEDIMVSVVPYDSNDGVEAEIFTCTSCSDDALLAMLKASGWNSNRTESFAWNISFESEMNEKTHTSYLVVKAYGEIPKQSAFAQLKADIDLTFDYATKTFSIKVAKLLKATYEQ